MWFVYLIYVVTAKRSAKFDKCPFYFTLHNASTTSYLTAIYLSVMSNTTLTLHYTTLLFWFIRGINTNLFTLQQKNIKEIELSLIWIRSESHVNLNRVPRKLYLSPKTIRNETYFKSKWNQFQSQKSLFALQYKQNREGWSQNRDWCVRDKSPFLGISHAYCSFDYQYLIRFLPENRDGW